MRSIFMDLATELREQGFRRILVIHMHGAPTHNRILDDAGDFFADTYGGRMVNLWGLMPVFGSLFDSSKLSDEARSENGLELHSGLIETSILLHLRPDLVADGYLQAEPQTVAGWKDLIAAAKASPWPGYTGSPRLARPEIGRATWEAFEAMAVDIALGILKDGDQFDYPRFGDVALANPVLMSIIEAASRYEERVKARQERWIVDRTGRP
jgi:creatinine amidohydrolase/Fe(II)-dependent formamide hydrolase-like protein